MFCKNNIRSLFACLVLTMSVATANAGQPKGVLSNPNLGALTVINTVSDVDGSIAGFVCADGSITGNPQDACGVHTILYPISGPVYAATVNARTGETIGVIEQIGVINATPMFDVSFFGLMGDWGAMPASLPWTMADFKMEIGGSVFEINEGMGLTGRAFPGLGPVEDPMLTGTMSLRMAGCEGIREVSGAGKYAGKVGSLCLNGTFTFDQNFNGKGVSNCSLVIHDPLQ